MLSVKPWQPMAVLQYCAAVLFCICLGGILCGILQHHHVTGFAANDDFGNLLLGTLSFQGSACGLMFVFFWYHRIPWRVGFGFSGADVKRALRLALLVFLVVLPIVWT